MSAHNLKNDLSSSFADRLDKQQKTNVPENIKNIKTKSKFDLGKSTI